MKLFIWEGDGISNAYHDDGTLVVLAETAAQAREVVRAHNATIARDEDTYAQRYQDAFERSKLTRAQFIKTQTHCDLINARWLGVPRWDGGDYALNREPDRIIELDTPQVVAFNGGGYD